MTVIGQYPFQLVICYSLVGYFFIYEVLKLCYIYIVSYGIWIMLGVLTLLVLYKNVYAFSIAS